ncbi:hypothetical protein MITS9508_00677 [Synechococcus sp. MIT S9508]|nr:hypothetical protein MITS9508_00677 [Synechococcus sp. MIT S9508]
MNKIKKFILHFVAPTLVYFLIFLGAGYKSFYFFDLDQNTGQGDSISYIQMHDGSFNVSPIHKYRVGIPIIARQFSNVLSLDSTDQLSSEDAPQARLSFFIVNTAIVSLAASITLLLALHVVENSEWFSSFAIVALSFLNPATIQNISTPMVDSAVPLFAILITYISIVSNEYWTPFVSIIFTPLNERIVAYLPQMMVASSSKKRSLSLLSLSIILSIAVNKLIQITVNHYFPTQDFAISENSYSYDLFTTTLHHFGNIQQVSWHYISHPAILARHILIDLGILQVVSIFVALYLYLSNKSFETSRSILQFFRKFLYVLVISIILVLMSGDVSRMLCTVVPFASVCMVLLATKFQFNEYFKT